MARQRSTNSPPNINRCRNPDEWAAQFRVVRHHPMIFSMP
jgi:hypothetical protein